MKLLYKLFVSTFCFSGMLLLLQSCIDSANKRDGGSSDSWLIFRGDAMLKGNADVKLSENISLLWSFKSESRTASSPVIYRNTVYWSDKRGKIYGVDKEGKNVFNYDFMTAIEATPLISDSTLYIGRIDGFMCAVSLISADTLWTFETLGQISASPNIGIFKGHEAIIFGSYVNYLYCLDKKTGKEINRFESGYYINGAVAVRQNYFFSGGCDAWLRIIDGDAGTVIDSLQLDTYIPASPVVDEDECFIADHSGNVYVLNVLNGKILSHRKIAESNDNSSTFISVPALSKSTLYILSDDRNLYALDRFSGTIRWKYLQKGNSGESSPLICQDRIVSCTKTGIISILSADDGTLLWEYDVGEQITASPAAVNSRLYILTAKGTLLCFGSK